MDTGPFLIDTNVFIITSFRPVGTGSPSATGATCRARPLRRRAASSTPTAATQPICSQQESPLTRMPDGRAASCHFAEVIDPGANMIAS